MKHLEIHDAPVAIHLIDGALTGPPVEQLVRRVGDLVHYFEDEIARGCMDPNQIVYEVEVYLPVEAGLEGGLCFGRTVIHPGQVGEEFFMTKGHFHAKADRGEFYWGIRGHGMLILMDQHGRTWAERMHPGSLHYIDGYVAHRTANIGADPLVFGACWPSDAGHNYEVILEQGFTARLKQVGDQARLVATTRG